MSCSSGIIACVSNKAYRPAGTPANVVNLSDLGLYTTFFAWNKSVGVPSGNFIYSNGAMPPTTFKKTCIVQHSGPTLNSDKIYGTSNFYTLNPASLYIQVTSNIGIGTPLGVPRVYFELNVSSGQYLNLSAGGSQQRSFTRSRNITTEFFFNQHNGFCTTFKGQYMEVNYIGYVPR